MTTNNTEPTSSSRLSQPISQVDIVINGVDGRTPRRPSAASDYADARSAKHAGAATATTATANDTSFAFSGTSAASNSIASQQAGNTTSRKSPKSSTGAHLNQFVSPPAAPVPGHAAPVQQEQARPVGPTGPGSRLADLPPARNLLQHPGPATPEDGGDTDSLLDKPYFRKDREVDV